MEQEQIEVSRQSKGGFLTKTLIKSGLAKNQKQANIVMVVTSIFCLIVMTYLNVSTYFPNLFNFSQPSPAGAETLQQRLSELNNGVNPYLADK